jgi:hypothetical protein
MTRRESMRCLFALAVASVCVASPQPALAGVKAVIAQNGELKMQVAVGPAASERTRNAAASLASYLSRMTGGKCAVQEGTGASELAVGTPADFPKLKLEAPLTDKDPTRREDYLLRSHGQGIWLIGATDLAVEHAVWDFLHRLGYRQFFPGETWEVVPEAKNLALAVDRLEQPDYYARRIWYGFGAAPWAKEEYLDWCAKNRAVSGIEINSGHAYDGILRRHEKEFAAHPEYLALVNGERGGARAKKFCIANAGLRELVVNDTLQHFAANPQRDCVSLDPSDGGGWCECEECRKLGSVSDRALMLANQAAEAVEKKHPGRFVAMYAYNEHSPPPTIRVHPRVVINVATSFIKGGLHRRATARGLAETGSNARHARVLLGAYLGPRFARRFARLEFAPAGGDDSAVSRAGRPISLRRVFRQLGLQWPGLLACRAHAVGCRGGEETRRISRRFFVEGIRPREEADGGVLSLDRWLAAFAAFGRPGRADVPATCRGAGACRIVCRAPPH